jgi:hypothetical protein
MGQTATSESEHSAQEGRPGRGVFKSLYHKNPERKFETAANGRTNALPKKDQNLVKFRISKTQEVRVGLLAAFG